jgi:hypothetical protein
VLRNYGKGSHAGDLTPYDLDGDVTYNGIVGIEDLNAVLSNYGKNILAGSVYVGGLNLDAAAIGALNSHGINTLVPEPGTLAMMPAAALGLSIFVLRKSS